MRLFLLLIALLSPGLLQAAASAPAKAKSSGKASDAPPELVSTTGGGKASKWNSIEEIKVAADKGDPAAAGEYAVLLEQGVEGVQAHFPKALTYYQTAAKAGNSQSAFRLGTLYHDGTGVTQDYAKAFAYYQQAAYAGDSLAQYNIGSMLVSARGMKRDWVEGLAWVIVATKNGADAEGEKQIRTQLGSRKDTIAAAEKRAVQIQSEIGKPRPPAFADQPAVTEKPTMAPAVSPSRPAVQMPPPVVAPVNKVTPPPISVGKP